MDKLFLKNLNGGNIKRSPELDGTICPGEKVKVFTVEGETLLCKIWNSSNNESFNGQDACKGILEQILDEDDVMAGSLSMRFNEIMFEIEEK
jgi:hypothetical protein